MVWLVLPLEEVSTILGAWLGTRFGLEEAVLRVRLETGTDELSIVNVSGAVLLPRGML